LQLSLDFQVWPTLTFSTPNPEQVQVNGVVVGEEVVVVGEVVVVLV
jgi:hypothetical protein